MTHLESRPSKTNPGSQYDFYVDCVCPADKKDELVSALRTHSLSVNVLSRDPSVDEGSIFGSNLIIVMCGTIIII